MQAFVRARDSGDCLERRELATTLDGKLFALTDSPVMRITALF